MRRIAAWTAAVVLLGGCGVGPSGVVSAGDAPVANAPAVPEASVYFLFRGAPMPVLRPVSGSDPHAALSLLVSGPTAKEYALGMRTQLGDVYRLDAREVDSRTLLITPRPTTAYVSALAYAQIYCTVMRFGWSNVRISGLHDGTKSPVQASCTRVKPAFRRAVIRPPSPTPTPAP